MAEAEGTWMKEMEDGVVGGTGRMIEIGSKLILGGGGIRKGLNSFEESRKSENKETKCSFERKKTSVNNSFFQLSHEEIHVFSYSVRYTFSPKFLSSYLKALGKEINRAKRKTEEDDAKKRKEQ